MQTQTTTTVTVGITTVNLHGHTMSYTNGLRLDYTRNKVQFFPKLTDLKEILKELKKERTESEKANRCHVHVTVLDLFINEISYERDVMCI